MPFPHDHEDTFHLHANTLPNRAYFIPHADRDSALTGVCACAVRLTLLSGTWNSGYCDSLLDLSEELFAPETTPDTIQVPSVWQCRVYDRHHYTNARFPIPYDPPHVPWDNPCGLYTRTFDRAAEQGETATLHLRAWTPACMSGSTVSSSATARWRTQPPYLT